MSVLSYDEGRKQTLYECLSGMGVHVDELRRFDPTVLQLEGLCTGVMRLRGGNFSE